MYAPKDSSRRSFVARRAACAAPAILTLAAAADSAEAGSDNGSYWGSRDRGDGGWAWGKDKDKGEFGWGPH